MFFPYMRNLGFVHSNLVLHRNQIFNSLPLLGICLHSDIECLVCFFARGLGDNVHKEVTAALEEARSG